MILFLDLDNTLYDQSAPFYEALSVFFSGSLDGQAEEICKAYALRSQESFYARERGEISMEEMYIYRVQKSLQDREIAVSAKEALAFQRLYEEKQRLIHVPGETLHFLERCRSAGIPLGLLSNGPGLHQREKLKNLGLTGYFRENWILISEECGHTKPEKEIFLLAQSLAAAEAGDMVYIGDSPENDILPARSLGWRAILYRKDPAQWKEIAEELKI